MSPDGIPHLTPSLHWPQEEGCMEQVALELGLQARLRVLMGLA